MSTTSPRRTARPAKGGEGAGRAADAPPTLAHELLSVDVVAPLSRWMDGQLEQLEGRFRDFQTRQSLRRSLGR